MQVVSSITMMPADPSIDPAFATASKLAATSSSCGIRIGTEELGARDSFFVPGGVPYTYRPGPDGVEVLEFRHATHFNFVNLSKGEAFWNKATETVSANREGWRTAKPPSVLA